MKVLNNENSNINIFKSSPISILDNTLKISWLATILIITNFAIIANKINEFNNAINVNLNISTNILIIAILCIFVIVMFIYYFINWKITRISYDEDKITIYKNIVIKDRYEFFIKNISGLVLEQNIIDKMFKIYRLKMYTEKYNNSKPDAHFFVKENTANELKDFVLNKLTLNKKTSEEINNLKDYDIKLKLKNIFLHSMFNISIGNCFIILNVILLIFSMIKEGTIEKEIMTNLLGFVITIFVIIFPILYSIISSILKFYGYKLKKVNDIILVKYGLFTTKSYYIPIVKIKGITIKETFISRIFNYNVLKVICSGISNKRGELDFLFPMISKKKIDNILKIILPDSNFSIKEKLVYQANFSISIYLVILTILNIVVIPILMYIKLKTLYIILYMLVSILVLIALYFFKRISINDGYILISTGFIIKKISLILYDSVKYLKISDGVISEKFNIYNLSMYITSSYGNVKQGVGYVTKNNLNKIRKKCFVNDV